MILDQDKFDRLKESKILNYNNKVSALFFELNNTETPCSMEQRPAILYHLRQSGVQFSEDEFTKEEKEAVNAFVNCLNSQMEKVIKKELKPVDLTLDEIAEMVMFTREEIEQCCMTSEDIISLMNG
jgi:hypothetical protein